MSSIRELFKLISDKQEFTFEEAVKFFKGKLKLTRKEFYELSDKYKALAFTVSNYTKAEVIDAFYNSLLSAIENGTTFYEFKKEMNTFLKDKGYKGMTNFQAENIFRTNIQTAYQVGHYSELTNPTVKKLRPFWQYVAVDDDRTRPAHRAMNGKIYPYDHPIWDTWYPPNGFKCRCTVVSYSKREIEAEGLKVETELPQGEEINGNYVSIVPDKHFSSNPAKVSFEPDIDKFPKSIRQAYEAQQGNKK